MKNSGDFIDTFSFAHTAKNLSKETIENAFKTMEAYSSTKQFNYLRQEIGYHYMIGKNVEDILNGLSPRYSRGELSVARGEIND